MSNPISPHRPPKFTQNTAPIYQGNTDSQRSRAPKPRRPFTPSSHAAQIKSPNGLPLTTKEP